MPSSFAPLYVLIGHPIGDRPEGGTGCNLTSWGHPHYSQLLALSELPHCCLGHGEGGEDSYKLVPGNNATVLDDSLLLGLAQLWTWCRIFWLLGRG